MPDAILIIDDERAIAQLASIFVASLGYEPVLAYDGKSGLACAAARRPRLILLDVRMPGMNGFEVNAELKRRPGLAEIPVIFLSAHVQDSARQLALSNGAVAFLSKPYDAKELSAVITAALDPALKQTEQSRAIAPGKSEFFGDVHALDAGHRTLVAAVKEHEYPIKSENKRPIQE